MNKTPIYASINFYFFKLSEKTIKYSIILSDVELNANLKDKNERFLLQRNKPKVVE